MRKVDKLFLVMEKREAEEKERLEANKAKLDALIGSLKVSERMMYWLHVCLGLVKCHGQDFLASVERHDAHGTFVMDCALPLLADEENEKDEQVDWDAELLLDCDELSFHELSFVDYLCSVLGLVKWRVAS